MRAEYSRRDCDADVGPLLATSMHPSWAAGDLWLPRSSSRSGGHLAPMLSEGTRTVTSPCPHVHGVRLHASTPARKPSPEVGASSNCVGASLRRDRRFVARASSSPSPPIRARYRDRTVPLRMRSADVMCVLVHHGDDLGRSRRSEVLRGMRRSLGLRAGEDGRGASVAHERDGWGCGDSGTRGIREDGGDPWIPRCFAHARLPHEPHFLEAHDIIADRDHLAARRAHLFRSRRRRHERHVLLKRLLIAGNRGRDRPIRPSPLATSTASHIPVALEAHDADRCAPPPPCGLRRTAAVTQQEPPCPLLALHSALDPRTASRVAANNEGGRPRRSPALEDPRKSVHHTGSVIEANFMAEVQVA